jgi:hypothetical protein
MKNYRRFRCHYKIGVSRSRFVRKYAIALLPNKNESRRCAEPFFCWTIYKASDNYERQANEQSYAEPIQQAIDPPNQKIGENEDW